MTKVLSISDPAYANLKETKQEDESFSDVIIRLTEQKKTERFLSLGGAWKNKKDVEARFKKVLDDRKNFSLRY